jgi:hypothetical protein
MLGFWIALAASCLLLVPVVVGVGVGKASRPGTLDRPTHRGWTWMAVSGLAGSALAAMAAVLQGPTG